MVSCPSSEERPARTENRPKTNRSNYDDVTAAGRPAGGPDAAPPTPTTTRRPDQLVDTRAGYLVRVPVYALGVALTRSRVVLVDCFCFFFPSRVFFFSNCYRFEIRIRKTNAADRAKTVHFPRPSRISFSFCYCYRFLIFFFPPSFRLLSCLWRATGTATVVDARVVDGVDIFFRFDLLVVCKHVGRRVRVCFFFFSSSLLLAVRGETPHPPQAEPFIMCDLQTANDGDSVFDDIDMGFKSILDEPFHPFFGE